jgi:catechol 2,3-dioxygenase
MAGGHTVTTGDDTAPRGEPAGEAPAGTVQELGHLVLYVRDLGRSVAFYRDVLGWRQVFPAAGQPVVGVAAFSGGRTHHELLLIEVGSDAVPIPAGRRVGLYHFGLRVGDSDDELRAALERVRAAGAKVVGASDHRVTHSLYIEDPDGNELELYVDVPGVDWRADPTLIASPIRPLSL